MLWPFLLAKTDQPAWREEGDWRKESRSTEPAGGPQFAFTLAAAFGVLAAVSAGGGSIRGPALIFGAVGGAFLLLGGTAGARAARAGADAWMGLARALSKVTTPIFMGVVYFLVITPMRRSAGRWAAIRSARTTGRSPAGWTDSRLPAAILPGRSSSAEEERGWQKADWPLSCGPYMRVRKKWWLAPILIVLLLVGALLVFAQGSALAPFIYTIF